MAVQGVGGGKIVSIDSLRARQKARAAQVDERAQAASASESPSDGAQVPDESVSLSPAAHRARDEQRLREEAKRLLDSLPEIRRDKVIEAKLRISTGHYGREEILAETMRRILHPERLPEDQVEPSDDVAPRQDAP